MNAFQFVIAIMSSIIALLLFGIAISAGWQLASGAMDYAPARRALGWRGVAYMIIAAVAVVAVGRALSGLLA